MIINIRNEIKAYIIQEGFTMRELVEKLAEQYGWSPSVPSLSDKLRRESLLYKGAVELVDALGYDLAMSLSKGKHAVIVCTHVDKHHIHSHIVFNSTALDCAKEF